MADFIVTKIADAIAPKNDGSPLSAGRPAVHELIMVQDAINEAGQAVKVRGQKMQINETQIDTRIAQLEAEAAKWKAIKAGLEK